jgi:hypothetical protein
VFVPHPGTWALELAELPPDNHDAGILRIDTFADLQRLF